MDGVFRLRVIVWILVLGLWAHITYQFIAEEEGVQLPEAMHELINPFPHQPLPTPSLLPVAANAQKAPTPPIVSASAAAPLATAAPFGNFIKPLPAPPPVRRPARPATYPKPTDESIRRHEFGPLEERQVAGSFSKTVTRHFVVFMEGGKPSQRILDTLENLHANLMLDLAAFSPWANDDKVSIYLFHTQQAYHRMTGRPAWSGGASSISKRVIYLYQSDEMIGILAHEMCHIYFDGYFLDGQTDPLWLSEGMATLVQVERGLATPNWMPENLEILKRGGGFRLSDLMRVASTASANDDNVRLWYTQSYSVVRFLLRLQGHAVFYHFCHYLKDGQTLRSALLNAYGLPYNRVQALEYAWRYNLRTHQLIQINTAP